MFVIIGNNILFYVDFYIKAKASKFQGSGYFEREPPFP